MVSVEIELKFRILHSEQIASQINALGFQATHELSQSDEYFSHPCRDFVETDEAVRIRTEGELTRLTYKGPKLDLQTKTRREIELDLGDGRTGQQMREILLAIGFKPAGHVIKRRVEGAIDWMDEKVVIALDTVDSLGDFVEFEIVTEDESGIASAREKILALAEHLELGESDRRSYLQILEESNS